ncbi:hypothetical protein IIV25_155R [Invertebrate iridovirus 25]|uniref:Uncharacterized protein n=1 Tax=Invertebrate iridovirus 25 TaxID=1301280 RepID=W8W1M6_9VIRU|nr:hypothetical protein IIV25_155R [Invertebrate iridovirus 25]CCV02173.1 hypothetical protein IIV25_155R [Invertebrate iridovirus 25]
MDETVLTLSVPWDRKVILSRSQLTKGALPPGTLGLKGLKDIFSFIKEFGVVFDISSNWFQDLWYPLSKLRPPQMGGPEKVNILPKMPIIVTQNLLEWMGFKGRGVSDKQERFSRVLRSHGIPYDEIDYQDPLALEYPCVQKESEKLKLSFNLKKKKWICMDQRNFKKAVMRINTENADIVRDYYLNLEEAMFAYGEYTMNFLIEKTERQRKIRDFDLSLAMEQLAINEEETKELEERLEQEKEARLKAEKEAEEHRQYSLVLKELTINDQKRPLNEIIYISTSKSYANQNRFKVGGVEGVDKLKPRFSGYNSRSSIDDEWFFSDLFKVANFKAAEKRIEDVLGRFREKKSKEIYVLHYNNLKQHIEWICNHYEDEIDQFNRELDMLISNLNRYHLRPIVPSPYQGSSAVITRIVDGIPTNTTIESTVEDQFKYKIKIYLDTLNPTTKQIKRTDLFSQVPFNFNKIEGWRWLKEITAKYKPDIKLNYR